VELCRQILEPSGFTVIAQESLAATAYLDPHYTVPDLVVYDVHGYDDRAARVLEELDASLRFRSTPLIMVSSSTWRQRERKAEGDLGPVKYLVRPLDPSVLIGAIDDCLGRNSAGEVSN
jgi:DNA-binding response OmpR family regulator